MRELSLQELNYVAGGDNKGESTVVDEIVVTADKKDDDGDGWYLKFGLGLGAGFTLTFSSSGVDASVGAGFFGIFEIGNADNEEGVKKEAEKSGPFAEVEIADVPVLQADLNTKTGDVTIGAAGVTISTDNEVGVGPVTLGADHLAIGFSAGIGYLEHVGYNEWNPPGGNS